MRWTDIDFHPSRRTLRQFATLAAAVFGTLSIWQWFETGEPLPALPLLAVAVAAAALGVAAPAALGPVYVTWTVLAFPVGWLLSRAILLFLFLVLVTPVALVFRIWRRDVLDLRRHPGRATYWRPLSRPVDDAAYLRQY